MTKTTGLLALLLASSCVQINEGDDDMLMTGSQAGKVGSPLIDVPAAAAVAVAPAGVGPLRRLISWQGDNKQDQRIIEDPRVLTASIIAVSANNTDGASGPITARIQWATGNGASQAAFVDVPVMSPNAVASSGGWGPDNSGSGVLVSVPADTMQVDVFNNARLQITPPGGNPLGNPVPVSASASISLGERPGAARPSLTIYGLYDPAGAGIAAAGFVDVIPPPFAKSFVVFRNIATAAGVTVTMFGTSAIDGPIAIAAGTPSPRFELPNNVAVIRLTNSGAGALNVLGCIFEIGL